MIGLAYYENGVIPTTADTAIKLSKTAGAVVDQILFEWLADKLGRKRMYVIELMVNRIIATFTDSGNRDRGIDLKERRC
jgi:PHS family inorganic phosphate transporter-like MFS transporter